MSDRPPTVTVRADPLPAQLDGVPLAWSFIAEWDTPERYRLELYAGDGKATALAIRGPYGPETAATVTDTSGSPLVKWQGTFTARPTSWQNEQAAIIRARLAESS